jgi:transcriptional regulator with XRE-family HTH domain
MGYSEQFKVFREARGFTREQLAALAGCHRNTVINVECGRRVKFATITQLMARMDYSRDSEETKLLAVLWLESVTGIAVSVREVANNGREAASARQRSSRQLQLEVTRRRLAQDDIDLLTFAVRHRKVLNVLREVRELVREQNPAGLST